MKERAVVVKDIPQMDVNTKGQCGQDTHLGLWSHIFGRKRQRVLPVASSGSRCTGGSHVDDKVGGVDACGDNGRDDKYLVVWLRPAFCR